MAGDLFPATAIFNHRQGGGSQATSRPVSLVSRSSVTRLALRSLYHLLVYTPARPPCEIIDHHFELFLLLPHQHVLVQLQLLLLLLTCLLRWTQNVCVLVCHSELRQQTNDILGHLFEGLPLRLLLDRLGLLQGGNGFL